MTTRSPRRPRPHAGRPLRSGAAAVLALALGASLAVAVPAGAETAVPAPANTGTALTGAASAAVAATPSRAAQVHARVPKLHWTTCASTPGGADLSEFQCARAKIPLDYDKPKSATTTVALTRLPATGPGKRIGTVFTNPGGPGGSGVDFVQTTGKGAFTAAVRARFDILGFDPRTVGASDSAACYAGAEAEQAALASMPAFPVGKAEERRFVLQNASLGVHCTLQSRQRIAHSSTANVARDMDLLRQAVGDKKLSYVGYSYGTYLGATYAQLFPGRTRAFVLDGTMNPDAYGGSDGDTRPVGARIGQGPAAYETYGECLRL